MLLTNIKWISRGPWEMRSHQKPIVSDSSSCPSDKLSSWAFHDRPSVMQEISVNWLWQRTGQQLLGTEARKDYRTVSPERSENNCVQGENQVQVGKMGLWFHSCVHDLSIAFPSSREIKKNQVATQYRTWIKSCFWVEQPVPTKQYPTASSTWT